MNVTCATDLSARQSTNPDPTPGRRARRTHHDWSYLPPAAPIGTIVISFLASDTPSRNRPAAEILTRNGGVPYHEHGPCVPGRLSTASGRPASRQHLPGSSVFGVTLIRALSSSITSWMWPTGLHLTSKPINASLTVPGATTSVSAIDA